MQIVQNAGILANSATSKWASTSSKIEPGPVRYANHWPIRMESRPNRLARDFSFLPASWMVIPCAAPSSSSRRRSEVLLDERPFPRYLRFRPAFRTFDGDTSRRAPPSDREPAICFGHIARGCFDVKSVTTGRAGGLRSELTVGRPRRSDRVRHDQRGCCHRIDGAIPRFSASHLGCRYARRSTTPTSETQVANLRRCATEAS